MSSQSATLGVPASHSGGFGRRQASLAPRSGRAAPRVTTSQATFGGSQPAPQRVREQSPRRIQAVAAPGLDRPRAEQLGTTAAVVRLEQQLEVTAAYLEEAKDLLAAQGGSLPTSISSNTLLERSRAHAERCGQLEAARAALDEAQAREAEEAREAAEAEGARLAALQFPAAVTGMFAEAVDMELRKAEAAQDAAEEQAAAAEQQAAVAARTAAAAEQQRLERRQRSAAAASTSGRPTAAAAAAKVTMTVRSTRAAAAARTRSGLTPVSPAEAAMTPALTSWLVECGTRQLGSHNATLAASPSSAAAAAGSAGASLRRRRLAGAASPQQQQAGAAAGGAAADGIGPDGLGEQTRQDTLALVNARLTLRKARGITRVRAGPSDSAMTSFMKGTGNTPVLGKSAEARLGDILQRGREVEAAATALSTAGGGRAVGEAEIAAAAGLAGATEVARRRKNAAEARDLLLQYNVRLVINIAKRYTASGIDIADLIPEGMVGLGKAVDRFEPSRGFKLSTYSHWWIRQAISRAVSDQARVVRLPSHVCESLFRINRTIASKSEQSESEEPPSFEDIAGEVGLPVSRVIQYLRLGRLPNNAPGGGRAAGQGFAYQQGGVSKEVTPAMLQDGEVDDGCGDEAAAAEVDREFGCMKAVTDLMLSTLPKRERNILRLRYGLLGWNQQQGMERGPAGEDSATMSLGEVAVAYGLSKERIRQIEDKAMRALRKPWRQQLVQELNFGQKVTPSSLSHLASAQQLALEEAL